MYIEPILLVDALIHTTFLKIALNLNHNQKSKWRYLISNFLNSGLMLIYLKGFHNKIILSLSILIILSPILVKRKDLLVVLTYIGLNYMLGGLAGRLFLIGNKLLIILLVIGFYLLLIVLKWRFELDFCKDNLYYDILIKDGKKKYYFKAFLDTGNLMEYGGSKVMIVSDIYQFGRKVKEEYAMGINGLSKIYLYEVDGVYFKKKNKFIKVECLLTFGSIRFDALVGLDIIGG